jgi:hypothetical protein
MQRTVICPCQVHENEIQNQKNKTQKQQKIEKGNSIFTFGKSTQHLKI